MRKTRFYKGTLVASTNALKLIQSKRLDIEVRYHLFGRVIKTEAVGIRQDLKKY